MSVSNNQNLRIVFFGTPEFAVASLDAMVKAGKNVVAVVTAPDKPAGRGMKLTPSAVKQYAEANNIPVLQPEKLKNPEFVETLRSYNAHLQVVVAFRMLPEVIWNMPPLGTINVHASLLPDYRGAAPINWAIINGEKETGVTTFKLQHEIDTGNILLQDKVEIAEEMTAGELHDLLKEKGAALLVKTIEGLEAGTIQESPQHVSDPASVKHAPKLFTEHCIIHWNQCTGDIYNLIRGLSPYPGAFTTLQGKQFKIYKCKKEIQSHHFEPGSFHTDGKTYLKFATSDGFIHCIDVQLAGKKRLGIEEFLRGYRVS